MSKLYLAYGSNLNYEQMARRCPTARPVCPSVLKGYRLVFRGEHGAAVANVEPCKDERVPVFLWEIEPKDEAALDRYEGFPFLYRKETVKVKLGRASVPAMAYIMNEGRPLALPGAYYYATIRQGYKDCGLDDAVLKAAAAFSAKEEEDER